MIRIGKYGMEPDTHCWQFGELATKTDDEGNEVEYLKNVKFPADIGSAFRLLLEKRLRDCDAESVADLKAELDRFRAELSSLFTIRVESVK